VRMVAGPAAWRRAAMRWVSIMAASSINTTQSAVGCTRPCWTAWVKASTVQPRSRSSSRVVRLPRFLYPDSAQRPARRQCRARLQAPRRSRRRQITSTAARCRSASCPRPLPAERSVWRLRDRRAESSRRPNRCRRFATPFALDGLCRSRWRRRTCPARVQRAGTSGQGGRPDEAGPDRDAGVRGCTYAFQNTRIFSGSNVRAPRPCG
jgi:hypothetical protein